jgi:hypothetical protein
MSSACRARNMMKCRVHGTGSMYEDLQQKRRDYLEAGNMDAYIATRQKMEWLIDNNQEALDFYQNNKGNKTKDNDIPLADRVENKLYGIADRVEEIKDNVGGVISEGVDLITDRHEAAIPAEIGGSTIAWSDMNPFKNGKLR